MELRPVRTSDLDSLYAISVATGAAGADASHLYADSRMMGHIYSAPDAVLSPGTAFVAEDDLGVAGYIVGVPDTRAFEALMEAKWWPALRAVYADPSVVPPASWNADQRRSFMIHHPKPVPEAVVAAFPAHLHMNLLPRAQGRGVGRDLLDVWLARMRTLGAFRVHLGTNIANTRSIRFWSAAGFERLDTPPDSTVWFGRILPG